ncbi:CPBP family intramembrane metalloprotease [Clostridium sp. YIM B02505]|uniref:CPBP family intramembrane metalloprotease n=1 Tax=Clostridium yunnanense TaxID=2800325 RepID=A0ABS1ERU7_9CLOT|nr:type II CAAX endopeptidase family protein [Clostridium yunnanense]MBK1812130.1 CPBP family intramembrane metalloprotease [Clostridium yunnanense]
MKKIKVNQNLSIVIKSLVLTIIAIVALELVLSLMRSLGLNILNDSLLGNVLLEATIFIVQLIILRKYSKGVVFSSIGLGADRAIGRSVFKGVLIGFIGTLLIYSLIFLLKIAFFEGTSFKYYDSKIVLFFVISMCIRALFAAVCEEVFFRGVLLNYLGRYKGKMFGLLASSLIFMIFHCTRYNSLYQLSSVLLGGIALGYLYMKTKSLYMSIGLHFATDFFMNLVGPKSQPSVFTFEISSKFDLDYLTQSLFILVSVAYLLLLFILFYFLKTKSMPKTLQN